MCRDPHLSPEGGKPARTAVLELALRDGKPALTMGRSTVSTAPVRSSPVAGVAAWLVISALAQRNPHSSPRRQPRSTIRLTGRSAASSVSDDAGCGSS